MNMEIAPTPPIPIPPPIKAKPTAPKVPLDKNERNDYYYERIKSTMDQQNRHHAPNPFVTDRVMLGNAWPEWVTDERNDFTKMLPQSVELPDPLIYARQNVQNVMKTWQDRRVAARNTMTENQQRMMTPTMLLEPLIDELRHLERNVKICRRSRAESRMDLIRNSVARRRLKFDTPERLNTVDKREEAYQDSEREIENLSLRPMYEIQMNIHGKNFRETHRQAEGMHRVVVEFKKQHVYKYISSKVDRRDDNWTRLTIKALRRDWQLPNHGQILAEMQQLVDDMLVNGLLPYPIVDIYIASIE